MTVHVPYDTAVTGNLRELPGATFTLSELWVETYRTNRSIIDEPLIVVRAEVICIAKSFPRISSVVRLVAQMAATLSGILNSIPGPVTLISMARQYISARTFAR